MVAIIVEDGSIVDGANSYVTTAELQTYADNRNITLSGDLSELLIQAMDFIESLSFIGIKKTKEQDLQWPRCYVRIDGYCFSNDEIPQELKKAELAVAVSIDQGNGPLSVIERTTKSETVGPISVTYMDSSAATNIDRNIYVNLRKLINGSVVGYNVKKA